MRLHSAAERDEDHVLARQGYGHNPIALDDTGASKVSSPEKPGDIEFFLPSYKILKRLAGHHRCACMVCELVFGHVQVRDFRKD